MATSYLSDKPTPSRVNKTASTGTAGVKQSQPAYGPSTIHSKATCSCGGGCPKCQGVQTKLKIASENDQFEREADRVADQVMQTSVQSNLPNAKNKIPTAGRHAELPGRLLSDSGQLLANSERSFFESRFGADFSDVRIHSNSRAANAAQAINARAFTFGRDIVFGANEYVSGSDSARKLVAHELTHVLQQRAQPTSVQRIQRQQRPEGTTPQQAQPQSEEEWINLVNESVRNQFGLSRVRAQLRPGHVNILRDDKFNEAYLDGLTESLDNKLVEIFLRAESLSVPGQILEQNGKFPNLMRIQEFVRAGIAANQFTWHNQVTEIVRDANGEFTERGQAVFHITPRQLIAESIAGFTTTEPNRRRRSVSLRRGFSIPTLTHETMHFYTHPRFYNFANNRADADERIGEARISQILIEGFTVFFTRRTVDANQPLFGPMNIPYPAEYAEALRIISTVGLPQAIRAYFFGDRAQIRRVGQAIEWYKTSSLDLLVPAFSNLSLPDDSES